MGSKPENTAEEFRKVVSQVFFLFVGEVEVCKLAVILLRRRVVGFGSFYFRFERAEVNVFAVQTQHRPPAFAIFIPGDALIF